MTEGVAKLSDEITALTDGITDLEQLHGRVVLRRDRDELVVLRLPRGRRLRDGLVEGGDAVRERRDLVRQLRDALGHLLDGRGDALDLELQVLLLVVRGLELGLAPLLLLLVSLLLVSKNHTRSSIILMILSKLTF